MKQCPCCSETEFDKCCEPFLEGEAKPKTAEELLRSRYTAYVEGNIDYIGNTLHPDKRDDFDSEAAKAWSEDSEWLSFEVLGTDKGGEQDTAGHVTFVAKYAQNGDEVEHVEVADFRKHNESWYFYDGRLVTHEPYVREEPKVGRNEPCPCGSGKKYKKCCANK